MRSAACVCRLEYVLIEASHGIMLFQPDQVKRGFSWRRYFTYARGPPSRHRQPLAPSIGTLEFSSAKSAQSLKGLHQPFRLH